MFLPRESHRYHIFKSQPPAYDFGAIRVPFSLFYTENDIFTGVATAREVIADLNATDYKIADADRMTHSDAILGLLVRCYYLDDILRKFERLENARDDEHRAYRRKVDDFVQSLPFEDGCVGREA